MNIEWPNSSMPLVPPLTPCRYCVCPRDRSASTPIPLSFAVCDCPCHWRSSVTRHGIPVKDAHLDAVIEFFRKDVEERLGRKNDTLKILCGFCLRNSELCPTQATRGHVVSCYAFEMKETP